jgi:hypothetical protein
MKTKNIILILITLAVTGAYGENLLKNSSFEEGGKNPEGWLRYLITTEQAVYSQKAAHSGKRGVGMLATSHKYGGGWIYEKMIPVIPGEKYCLSGWIKPESWGGNCISIAWFGVKNGRPKWKSTSRSKFVNGKKNWTQVKLNVTVPEKVSFAKINLGRKWKATGAVYFDDIHFEKLSHSKPAENKLEIPWKKAIQAEKISINKLRSQEVIPIEKWQKMQAPAGTLKKAGKTLEISNTALKGVGWMSPAIKLMPGKIYGFKADIELKKAYHVALGVALFDTSGKLLEIRSGKLLRGTKKVHESLSFRTPPKTASARFLLTQSRSSGTSRFSKLSLLK